MMTNPELLEFCYRTILRRSPDEDGFRSYLQALEAGSVSREQVMVAFLESHEFKEISRRIETAAQPEFVPAGHYYSAIPSQTDCDEALARNVPTPRAIPGVDINLERQLELLDRLKVYFQECPFPDEKSSEFRYYFRNRSYSHGDGLTLYAMIRHLKPKRIIEIGSGYSSALMLDTNDLHFGGKIEFTFIEPYADLLRSLLTPRDTRCSIIEKRLQDVTLDVFGALQPGDILFVDSTHVGKLNSDVLRIIFDILPTLPRGVNVHVHDAFWPFEYPATWIKERRAWNELYFLHAFLMYNSSFSIQLFPGLLMSRFPEWFDEFASAFRKNAGGNIWLQRS